jgi:predicted nucleic acid-binding protein
VRWTRSAASADLALLYTDTSALVKLVRDEPESEALRAFLADADLVSCELILTELPRALRRAAAHDPELPLALLLERSGELLEALAMLPLDRALLESAIDLLPLDAFISYDERQSAAARLAGLRTVSPG